MWLEDGLARNTIASYRSDLEQFFAFLKDRHPTGIGEQDLFAFLAAPLGHLCRVHEISIRWVAIRPILH